MSVRIAALAFGLHALLLTLDVAFFGAAYGGRPGATFMVVLRIGVFCLFVWSLLRGESNAWIIGLTAVTAFLLRDLLYLGDILRTPGGPPGLALLTTGLLTSLIVGIVALLWPKASALRKQLQGGFHGGV